MKNVLKSLKCLEQQIKDKFPDTYYVNVEPSIDSHKDFILQYAIGRGRESSRGDDPSILFSSFGIKKTVLLGNDFYSSRIYKFTIKIDQLDEVLKKIETKFNLSPA